MDAPHNLYKTKIEEIKNSIFELEKTFPYDEEIRKKGYRIRIQLGEWEDAIEYYLKDKK